MLFFGYRFFCNIATLDIPYCRWMSQFECISYLCGCLSCMTIVILGIGDAMSWIIRQSNPDCNGKNNSIVENINYVYCLCIVTILL